MIDKQELSTMLAWHRPFHSNEQIDRFILAAHGITTFGVFKQCLRELDSRWFALRSMWVQSEAAPQAREHANAATAQELVLRQLAHPELRVSWKDTAREFVRFYAHAKVLYAKLTEEGPLTAERVEALDRAEWFAYVIHRAALDVITNGRPARDTLAFICTFEPDARQRALTEVQSMCKDDSAAWKHALVVQDVPTLPDVEVDIDEVRALVAGAISELPDHALTNGHAPRLHLLSKEAPSQSRLYQEDSAHNGHDPEC